jgi:hypothetical protein
MYLTKSLTEVFDLQFWILIGLFFFILIGSQILVSLRLKKGLISAISESVAEVVKNQWDQMFKKLDEYQNKVNQHDRQIEELNNKYTALEKKSLDKCAIEKIVREVQDIK